MKRNLILMLLLLCTLLGLPGTVHAAPARQVVIVVIDGLWQGAISEEETPNLIRLQQMGAVGVMNHNTLSKQNDVNTYLTIGAGSKASAPIGHVRAYGLTEPVKEEQRPATGRDLYLRHLGREPQGEIVVPQIPQIRAAAESANYKLLPGQLGDAVHDLGGRTAVFGNTDHGAATHRPAALIAMDSGGTVDLGSLPDGLLPDGTRPFGVRTDYAALERQFLQARREAALIVLETGDAGRVRAMRDQMTDEQAERAYRQAIREADGLIGKLLPAVGPQLLLAVVSPAANPLPEAPTLSPVILAGGAISPGSLLTSGTTKRDGLIANYDLAPTFVQALGGDAQDYPFLGQPVSAQPVSGTLAAADQLDRIVENMLLPSGMRRLLVRPWLNIWIGAAALILFGTIFRQAWLRYVTPVAELLLIFPLVWLYVPLFHPLTGQDITLYTILLALAAWGGLQLIRQPLQRYGALAGLTVLTLLGDMLLGAPLMKESVFSYDPVVGARYYGIGNEYMGLLLGAALLLLNVLLALYPGKGKLGTLVLFFAIVLLFAAPSFGTNAGGAMAAAIGGSYAFLQVCNVRMTLRNWLWIGGGAAVGLGLLFALNLGGEQTHIGRAATLLLGGNFAEVWQILQRKVELNLHLLRVSAWGKLLLLFIATLLVWRLKRAGSPFLLHNFKTQLVTAAAAFLVNDSGVVAAAIILLFAVVPLLSIREPKLDILPTEQAPQEWTTR
ncbi:hypothetical protein EV586_10367 [Tumebacillus sp. BK434]|uniref:hypothetical protein n=1 Tax=Tumebacillus sp. BK434 TaxID=2512169 RepID=UPI001052A2E0|nr:hypothetical protein [Tumebacillus sp. BK434]TCP55415.1 hypothetical protein EV586_10367 [Tumebacillus sp. BK434]